MKYTTFRNSLLAGGALVVAGGIFWVARPAHVKPATAIAAPAVPAAETPSPKPTPEPERGGSTATRGAADPAVRGLVATPTATAPATGGQATKGAKTPLREMDREILKLYATTKAQAAKAAKTKDVFPNRPYKVNLYVEGDQIRVKVDLNRNGKWDEKWSFEPGSDPPVVKRQVAPADDDTNYTETYKTAGDTWVQK